MPPAAVEEDGHAVPPEHDVRDDANIPGQDRVREQLSAITATCKDELDGR